MSSTALENLLRDLPRVGTLIKDRGYRQVWRFDFEGQGYFLKFYPRKFSLKRLFRGNPAGHEFVRLQALQKAAVPAPRAVAQLIGFKLNGIVGDAVILHAIEPSITLDRYISEFGLRGEEVPHHAKRVRQVLDLILQLGRARLGHNDLHLGNILMHEDKLYLLDAYAVRFGGLTLANVMQLAHSVRGLATRADLQRGWELLGPGGPMPRQNTVSQRQWRKFLERAKGENPYFGKLRDGPWRGIFFKHYKFPPRWAPASKLDVSHDDWNRAWPILLDQMLSGKLTVIKASPSGDVYSGEVTVGGKTIPVILKRPYKRHWYRYINELTRGSRPWRAWNKSWNLIVRNLPTAWPLLVMQKRKFGYITDAVIVFERCAGTLLGWADLDAIPGPQRELLFRRTGQILRQIDDFGFAHFDAKPTNWIVQEDEKLGPRPILIDVDGIRRRRWTALGIERLLRGMRDHPQYTPDDSRALCQGYAPFAPLIVEEDQNL